MSTIITKNSSTTTAVPLDADLVEGEMAVNTTDGTLYVGKASGVTAILVDTNNAWTGSNTFEGAFRSKNPSSGTNCIALGGGETLQGNSCVAVGRGASDTQGANSTAIGAFAGQFNVGTDNVIIGTSAAIEASSTQGVYIGRLAGQYNKSTKAVAIGYRAGRDTTGVASLGTESVAVGAYAGETTQDTFCTAIGVQAGQVTQGTQAVALGYKAGITTQGVSAVAIGALAGATTQHDNSIVISSVGTAINSAIDGGITIQSTTAILGASGANWSHTGTMTSVSDRRLKKDIEPITSALDKVQTLNGVTFEYLDENAPDRATGLIAQDVQAVLPEAVVELADGHLAVGYGNIAGLLVEAIKELRAEVAELKGE